MPGEGVVGSWGLSLPNLSDSRNICLLLEQSSQWLIWDHWQGFCECTSTQNAISVPRSTLQTHSKSLETIFISLLEVWAGFFLNHLGSPHLGMKIVLLDGKYRSRTIESRAVFLLSLCQHTTCLKQASGPPHSSLPSKPVPAEDTLDSALPLL